MYARIMQFSYATIFLRDTFTLGYVRLRESCAKCVEKFIFLSIYFFTRATMENRTICNKVMLVEKEMTENLLSPNNLHAYIIFNIHNRI